MTGKGTTRRGRRVASPPVAALAALPAGPGLCAALAALDLSTLTGFDLPLVLRARYRQGNYERAQLLDAVAQTMRRKDPEFGVHHVSEDEVGMHEIRTALTMSRTAANNLASLARDLTVRLPTVLAAMRAGALDQPRARVFSAWTSLLADAHAQAIVDALLPLAPTMTTGELIAAIQKAAIELDPQWARRRYERSLSQRRVHGIIGEDGTATIIGEGLPADQVASACDRLDAIAWHLKRAGHPSRLDHIRADIYLGLLDGTYAGLTDEELLTKLLANIPATPDPATPDPTAPDPVADPPSTPDTQPDTATPHDRRDQRDQRDERRAAEPAAGRPGRGEPASRHTDRSPGNDQPPGGGPPDAEPSHRPAGSGSSTMDPATGGSTMDAAAGVTAETSGSAGAGPRLHRRGLRLWVALATIAGVDRRPAELLGWSMLHAELARRACAAPGASWWYVLTADDGSPVDVGPIRRRPTRPWWDGQAAGYPNLDVWLQLTRTELATMTAHPPPGWQHLIADLAHRLTNSPAGAPNGDPTDRFPSAGLRRFIQIRDRRCLFPGCRIAPHRCEADHTLEHATGGPTVDANLADICSSDHQLKTRHGWTVQPIAPGHLLWTSPLGHEYQRTPPPGPAHSVSPMPTPTRPDDDRWQTYEPDLRPGTSSIDLDYSPTTCLTQPPTPRPPTQAVTTDPKPEPAPQPVPTYIERPDDDIPPF